MWARVRVRVRVRVRARARARVSCLNAHRELQEEHVTDRSLTEKLV